MLAEHVLELALLFALIVKDIKLSSLFLCNKVPESLHFQVFIDSSWSIDSCAISNFEYIIPPRQWDPGYLLWCQSSECDEVHQVENMLINIDVCQSAESLIALLNQILYKSFSPWETSFVHKC